MTLVEYLREKLEAARVGCTCPTSEYLAKFPAPGVVLTDCVEHGHVRSQCGPSFGWRAI